MGGSAVGGRLARGALGAAPAPPARRAPTATRCRAGPAPDDARAVRELLGHDRGDAGRLRRRRRARRAAARRRPPAARSPSAPARDGVPVIPLPGRLPAARGGRLLARRRARGGRALRRRAVAARRDRGRGRARRGARARVGAGRRRGRRGQGARARAARHDPGDRRRRARGRRSPTAGSARSTRTPALPAFASALPELDHNEVVGWAAARELGALLAPSSSRTPARTRATALRIELTAEQVARRRASSSSA